jgi:F0F1-type ATP synthase assembly protein I
MPVSIDGDQERQRRELEERLARRRKLAREHTEGMTAKNLRELAAEIEQEIRSLDPSPD